MNEQAMQEAFEVWFRRTYDMPGTVAFEWGAPTIVNMFQSWQAGRADAISAPVHTSLVNWEFVAQDMFAIINHPVKAGRVWASYDVNRIREAVERFRGAKSTQNIEARNAAPVGVSPEVALSRSLDRWEKVDPNAITQSSEAAIFYLVTDARNDILTLAKALGLRDE